MVAHAAIAQIPLLLLSAQYFSGTYLFYFIADIQGW